MNLFGLQITKAPPKPKVPNAAPLQKVDVGAMGLYVLGAVAQLTPSDIDNFHVDSHLAHTLGIVSIVAGLLFRANNNPSPPKGEVSVTAAPARAVAISNTPLPQDPEKGNQSVP